MLSRPLPGLAMAARRRARGVAATSAWKMALKSVYAEGEKGREEQGDVSAATHPERRREAWRARGPLACQLALKSLQHHQQGVKGAGDKWRGEGGRVASSPRAGKVTMKSRADTAGVPARAELGRTCCERARAA